MCDPKTHIPIHKVTGGRPGRELLGCFFQFVEESGGENIYKFFHRDGREIIDGLHVNSEFEFELHQKIYWMNIKAADCEFVGGQWKLANENEPDQSYQAQAGGTVEDETNAAAATVQ